VRARIEPLRVSPAADVALERLLYESYVTGGFTDVELAHTLRASAVRSRGTVLVAYDESGTILGTVTLVSADSPARRLATADEAELHLLCVRPDLRRNGIGRLLVQETLALARVRGALGAVLWTQPTMDAAQRLYVGCGFRRDPSADFRRGTRQFLVYRCSLASHATPPDADLTSIE
jgi:GNAT superfamily N-acetyltransferase